MPVLPNISGILARYLSGNAKVERDGTLIEWPDDIGSNPLYVPTRHNFVTRSRRALAGRDVVEFAGSGLESSLTLGAEATVVLVGSILDRPNHVFYTQDARFFGGESSGVFLREGHRGSRPTPTFTFNGEVASKAFTKGYRVFSFTLGSSPGFRINGVPQTLTGELDALPISKFLLGGEGFHASIAEVLVYDRALTSSELDQLETYLENEYDLAPPLPVASITTSSLIPVPGATVSLDGSGSTGNSLTYSWELIYPTTGMLSSSTASTTTFVARNGVYYAELTVEDLLGQVAKSVIGIDVDDPAILLPPETLIVEAVSRMIVSSTTDFTATVEGLDENPVTLAVETTLSADGTLLVQVEVSTSMEASGSLTVRSAQTFAGASGLSSSATLAGILGRNAFGIASLSVGTTLTAGRVPLLEISGLYNPDILLDFNQSPGQGATIPDVSGNGRDFTADGVEGVDFTWKGGDGHLAGTPGRIELLQGARWTSDVAFNAQHSFVLPAKIDLTGAGAGWAAHFQNGGRLIIYGNSSGLGFVDSTVKTTAYDAGLDNEFTYGMTYEAGGVGTFYVNGLPIFSRAADATLDIASGADLRIGERNNDANIAAGDYDATFKYKNGLLSAADHYDIYGRLSDGKKHFYKEVVTDELGVQANCAAYHPFWETDGTSGDCMDVSGNEAHGAYSGGPLLGQEPLDSQHLYSIGGTTGQVTLTTNIDVNTDNFTCAVVAEPMAGANGGLIVFGGAAQYIGVPYVASTGNIRLQVNAGGGGSIDLETLPQPASTYGLCIRRNGSTVDWWVNGTKLTPITITTPPVSSTRHLVKTWGHDGIGVWRARVQHRGTYDAALTDVQCARLSTI